MIDLNTLISSSENILGKLQSRGEEIPLDNIKELDSKRKNLIQESDQLRSFRNSENKRIGDSKEKPSLENPDLISHLSVSDRCEFQVWIFFRLFLLAHLFDEDTLEKSYFESLILGPACRPHKKNFGKLL